jgi:hypothetical protein
MSCGRLGWMYLNFQLPHNGQLTVCRALRHSRISSIVSVFPPPPLHPSFFLLRRDTS